jgi:hypothetical protein
MIIVRYTGKKLADRQYIVTSFAKRSSKDGQGLINSFRFFEDHRFPNGYWDTVTPYENPSILDVRRNHERVASIPNGLKWHIFDTIFNGKEKEFKDICVLIMLKG